ncbi:hypothetical protein [Streptomyces sp. NPDC001404]|uniref:hypothetical protein n=1 Tax=Streptomyces sp. NPDC001404 TaxID=3364571 RepID=UPI003688796E
MLVDRAVALGWEADRVLVIDDDLAMPATTAVARRGFQRLVTEIGVDHVGPVLGIEMSRGWHGVPLRTPLANSAVLYVG